MAASNGRLTAADESLTHQIAETFSTVAQSDPSWTEKVWASCARLDGSLQVVVGLGRYANLGVFDAAAGASRGTEQWTVRASRRLSADPGTSAGPIHYEVTQPLQSIRAVLEPTEHAAVAFDVTWIGELPASLEEPWVDRSADDGRITHQALRYHQVGTAEGWVEVDGERTEVVPGEWLSVRDHSWGLRPGVGPHAKTAPGPFPHQIVMTWFPMRMQRADGAPYSLFAFYERRVGPGLESTRSQAEEQSADGGSHRFAAVAEALEFHDENRRVRGGTITLIDVDGSERPLHVRPVSGTGFHLGTSGYFGWRGHSHGRWMGELEVDGEHLAGLDAPELAREAHQLRDLLVEVDDPVGGGRGHGVLETMIVGAFPERGLSAETSFL